MQLLHQQRPNATALPGLQLQHPPAPPVTSAPSPPSEPRAPPPLNRPVARHVKHSSRLFFLCFPKKLEKRKTEKRKKKFFSTSPITAKSSAPRFDHPSGSASLRQTAKEKQRSIASRILPFLPGSFVWRVRFSKASFIDPAWQPLRAASSRPHAQADWPAYSCSPHLSNPPLPLQVDEDTFVEAHVAAPPLSPSLSLLPIRPIFPPWGTCGRSRSSP
jgi:hypothetical protein